MLLFGVNLLNGLLIPSWSTSFICNGCTYNDAEAMNSAKLLKVEDKRAKKATFWKLEHRGPKRWITVIILWTGDNAVCGPKNISEKMELKGNLPSAAILMFFIFDSVWFAVTWVALENFYRKTLLLSARGLHHEKLLQLHKSWHIGS